MMHGADADSTMTSHAVISAELKVRGSSVMQCVLARLHLHVLCIVSVHACIEQVRCLLQCRDALWAARRRPIVDVTQLCDVLQHGGHASRRAHVLALHEGVQAVQDQAGLLQSGYSLKQAQVLVHRGRAAVAEGYGEEALCRSGAAERACCRVEGLASLLYNSYKQGSQSQLHQGKAELTG